MGSHSRGLGGPAGCPTWALRTLLFPVQNTLEWGKKKTAIFVQKFHNRLLLTLQPSECIKNVHQKKKKKSISGACFGRKGALYCLCAALTVVIIISIIISSIIVMFG